MVLCFGHRSWVNSEPTLNLLINGGANLECKDSEGVYCYEDLRFAFSNFGKKGWIGTFPLSRAVKNSHYDVVKLLLKSKSNIDFAHYLGRTALAHAILINDPKMVDLLIKFKAEVNGIIPDIYSIEELSFIYQAAQMNSFELVRSLLDGKADPNQDCEVYYKSALCAVFENKDADIRIVKLLIEYKANINDESGVLANAVIRCDFEIVKTLIDSKADPNLCDDGVPPLYYAAVGGHTNKVDLLLDAKADVNLKTKAESRSGHHHRPRATFHSKNHIPDPLSFAISTAVRFKHYDIVEELLRRGADHRHIFESFTPSELSRDEKLIEILKIRGIENKEYCA